MVIGVCSKPSGTWAASRRSSSAPMSAARLSVLEVNSSRSTISGVRVRSLASTLTSDFSAFFLSVKVFFAAVLLADLALETFPAAFFATACLFFSVILIN